MVDVKSFVDELLQKKGDHDELIRNVGPDIALEIVSSKRKILDLVKDMNELITSTDYELRTIGLNLLTAVITNLKHDTLNTKEIAALSEFVRLRLVDYITMEELCMNCLIFFMGCKNKPDNLSHNLATTLRERLSKKNMPAQKRQTVIQLLHCLLVERYQQGKHITSDLVYAILHFYEGETDPRNLMLCFKSFKYLLKNFDDLEPYIDEIYEWLNSYIPLYYRPKPEEDSINSEDLERAVHECLFAHPPSAVSLIKVLIDRIESNHSVNSHLFKILKELFESSSLDNLLAISRIFWSQIRLIYLKKLPPAMGKEDDIQKSKELGYEALAALAQRLAEDRERYEDFFTDMYEEIKIALTKHELDLYESAIGFLSSAAVAGPSGLDVMVKELVLVATSAIEKFDTRPLAGLTCTFNKLKLHDSQKKPHREVVSLIEQLVIKTLDPPEIDERAAEFLQSLLRYKIEFSDETLSVIVEKLLAVSKQPSKTHQDCLILLLTSYRRYDILFDDSELREDVSLNWLTMQLDRYKALESGSGLTSPLLKKFRIYLAVTIKYLQSIAIQEFTATFTDDYVKKYLDRLRNLATHLRLDADIVDKIATIHALNIIKPKQEFTNSTLSFCQSDFCQKLKPTSVSDAQVTVGLYLPLIQYVAKAHVLRNSQFVPALTNLVFNFTSSDDTRLLIAKEGVKVFSFVQDESSLIPVISEGKFNTFPAFKQKFYLQSFREARIRFEKHEEPAKKCLIIACIAVQVPFLGDVLGRLQATDTRWILEKHIKCISPDSGDSNMIISNRSSDWLIDVMYKSIEILIREADDETISMFLDSLVTVSLTHAQDSRSMLVRQRALRNLAEIARCDVKFIQDNLLNLRSDVVEKLRPMLGDKKRLVRQAAADARLYWVLVGQPVGFYT